MTISRTDETAPDADSSESQQPDVPSTPDGYDPAHPELTFGPGQPDSDGNILCYVIDGRPYEVEHYGMINRAEALWWINEHELSIKHTMCRNDVFVMTKPLLTALRPDRKGREEPKHRNRAYVDRDAIQKASLLNQENAPQVPASRIPAHLSGKGGAS